MLSLCLRGSRSPLNLKLSHRPVKVDESGQVFVGQAIIDPGSLAAVGDQPGVLQRRPLLRDVGLSLSQQRGQVADAGLLLRQDIQDAQRRFSGPHLTPDVSEMDRNRGRCAKG